MIQHTLTLNYKLSPGWMHPYLDALQRGEAASLHCSSCDKTSFPPVRTCSCGREADSWRLLSGKARIVHVCYGLDGHFALVQFEGADTQSVVQLQGFDETLPDAAKSDGWPDGVLQPLESEEPVLLLKPDRSGLIGV